MTQSDTVRLAVPVTNEDHVEGPDNAPVTLVEYGDFECPYCRTAYEAVKGVRQRVGDRVRFVFRNFPLWQSHPHAVHAAEAAEAAGKQGKFWEMHDMLYEHQSALDDEHLEEYARILSLNLDEFTQEMESGAFEPRLEQDMATGEESGVEGTPTFFINGVRYEGSYDPESLLEAVEAAARR